MGFQKIRCNTRTDFKRAETSLPELRNVLLEAKAAIALSNLKNAKLFGLEAKGKQSNRN